MALPIALTYFLKLNPSKKKERMETTFWLHAKKYYTKRRKKLRPCFSLFHLYKGGFNDIKRKSFLTSPRREDRRNEKELLKWGVRFVNQYFFFLIPGQGCSSVPRGLYHDLLFRIISEKAKIWMKMKRQAGIFHPLSFLSSFFFLLVFFNNEILRFELKMSCVLVKSYKNLPYSYSI